MKKTIASLLAAMFLTVAGVTVASAASYDYDARCCGGYGYGYRGR